MNKIYSPSPKKKNETNKTRIESNVDTWCSELLDMNEYNPNNNRGFRYILVVIDNFSKFGRTIPLMNK